MHPELIKAQIRMAGSTPALIAEELGVCPSTVSHVIYRRGRSARVAQRIAQITGIAEDVLWPPQKALQRKGVRRVKPAVGAATA